MRARKFLMSFAALAMVVTPAMGAEKDSWRCLPKQTIGAFRIDNSGKVYESVKANTQLGAVLFRDDRIAAIKKLMRESDPAAWEQANAQLAEYNLSVDMLMKLASAKFGIGVLKDKHVAADRPDPLMMALVWVETDAELMNRLMAAFEKGWQENQGGPGQPERKDIALAGHKVVHLITNQKRNSFQVEFDDGNDGGGAVQPRRNAQIEVAEQQNDQSHFLMTQTQGKLLMAMTLPNNQSYVDKLREANKPVDWAKVSGESKVKEVLAQFLNAHAGEGEPDGFASAAAKTPGMDKALPKGTVWMEGYFQVSPFIEMMEKAKPGLADQVGIGRLAMMGMRTTVEGNTFDSGGFISLPAPHRGVMRALTEGRSAAAAPGWVPADVAFYGHLELDLGKLYTAAGQLDVGGNVQALGASVVVEGLAATMAKTDFASVLTSLGSRHSLLVFGAKDEQELAAAQDRIALVWKLQKTKVWDDVFANVKKQRDALDKAQAEGNQAAGQNLPVRVVDKGKYKVMLFDNPRGGPTPGVYFGSGHLVMAASDIAAERILGAIAQPPQGEKALVNSPLYKAAVKQLPVEEGMALQYTNAEMMSGDQLRIALNMLRREWANGGDNEDPAVKILKDILPTDAELKGAFGATASQTYVGNEGIFYRSVWKMPAKR